MTSLCFVSLRKWMLLWEIPALRAICITWPLIWRIDRRAFKYFYVLKLLHRIWFHLSTFYQFILLSFFFVTRVVVVVVLHLLYEYCGFSKSRVVVRAGWYIDTCSFKFEFWKTLINIRLSVNNGKYLAGRKK